MSENINLPEPVDALIQAALSVVNGHSNIDQTWIEANAKFGKVKMYTNRNVLLEAATKCAAHYGIEIGELEEPEEAWPHRVDQAPMDERITWALAAVQIHDAVAVMQRTEAELLVIENIGPAAVKQLNTWLDDPRNPYNREQTLNGVPFNEQTKEAQA